MKKEYIKMNDNGNYLSLGNLFRVIKEESKNKSSALQVELFSILFDDCVVNETTVNNYCVGCRRIGDDYKQLFLNKKKKYSKDSTLFVGVVLKFLSIMDGVVYQGCAVDFINQNESMKRVVNQLYNIAKNDENVLDVFVSLLNEKIRLGLFYEAFVEMLFYVVLEHKQPVYLGDREKSRIEKILRDSCMSYKGLEDYLVLTFYGNVNHDFILKRQALEGNVYANYELGSKEYLGLIAGVPRYVEAYKYLKVASDAGHAGALYTIGSMYLRGFIGSDEKRYGVAYEYFLCASQKGNVAALNSLGLMYLNGYYVEKDKEKARELFLESSSKDCVYACNNLGKMFEGEKNYDKAFSYYLKSALLGESWACNAVAEWYRVGNHVKKDMVEAYHYYEKAIDCDYKHTEYYAYYNLAKYFYLDGEILSGVSKDICRYLEYMEIAFDNGVIDAGMELFLYYVKEYYKNKDMSIEMKIDDYKKRLESHRNFTIEMKEKLENDIRKIKEKVKIEWDK